MARIAIALLLLSHSAAGAWRRVADLPFALSDFTATLVPNRGRIVIVGGCDEDQVAEDEWTFCPSISKKVLLYDYAADTWSRGLDAPRERYRHAAATDGQKLYVLGGRDVAENLVPQTDVCAESASAFKCLSCSTPLTRRFCSHRRHAERQVGHDRRRGAAVRPGRDLERRGRFGIAGSPHLRGRRLQRGLLRRLGRVGSIT